MEHPRLVVAADPKNWQRMPLSRGSHETDHGKILRYPAKTLAPYRFAILVDKRGLRRWEFWCVRRLIETQSAVPGLVGVIEPHKQKNQGVKDLNGATSYIRRLYERLFCRLPSLQRVATEELVQTLGQKKHGVKILRETALDSPVDREGIQELELDFILGFAEPEMVYRYGGMARLGVWQFSGLNGESLSQEVPFLDSLLSREQNVQVSLLSHPGEEQPPRPLWTGCYRVDPNSPGRDLERVLRDLSKWPLWVCGRMHHGSSEMLGSMPPKVTNGSRPGMSIGKELNWPLKLIWGKVTQRASEIFLRPQWNIAVLNRPVYTLLADPVADDARFLEIGRNVDTFWADPFGLPGDGFLTILFEQFDYDSAKGIIAFLKFSDRGLHEDIGTVFAGSHHLSYPFLFEDEGNIYCVPESGQAGRIEIHRAVRFPETWEPVALVSDSLSGIDSTVFRHNGLWWLACTLMEHELNTNLFLYYAEHLTGPWTMHRGNPVKTDVRSSRPAGTPFVYGGELYRPSQDCSRSYGGRVCINRVLRLDPSEFVEVEVCTIEPVPASNYPDGLHTISAVGDQTLIDGLCYRFTLHGVARSIRRRCRTLVEFAKGVRGRQTQQKGKDSQRASHEDSTSC